MKKSLLGSVILAAVMMTGCTSGNTATNTVEKPVTQAIVVRENLKVVGVVATDHDGNGPENVLDGSYGTRWSSTEGNSITLELVEESEVSAVNIAFSKGAQRQTKFAIETSVDGEKWERVFYGLSSGKTEKLEKYTFPRENAKFVRVVGWGNTSSWWNSLTVVEVEGIGAVNETASLYDGAFELGTTKAAALLAMQAEGTVDAEVVEYVVPTEYEWEGNFTKKWREEFDLMSDKNFGLDENIQYKEEDGKNFIRVSYPEGSISSGQAKVTGSPLGGAQFYTKAGLEPAKEYELSYKVRFSENFDFVKGGKLPGLYGGDRNASGQRVPDGTSGWSTRFMWRAKGAGEVYTYMPSSVTHGSSLGRGEWTFVPGQWHEIVQRVKLNTVGEKDGEVEVYLDGVLVHKSDDLVFRTVDTLKIDGLFFSTFFGGSDPSWASTADVYTDYADFKIAK